MGRVIQYILVVLTGLVLAVGYQQCGNSAGDVVFNASKGFPIIKNAGQGGNGDGLDGKPVDGTWTRTNNDFDCKDTSSKVQALVTIANRLPTLVHDNCRTKNFVFSLLDSAVSFQFYNPKYFTFSGSIFEYADTKTPSHINDSLCRFLDSKKGIDVVIQINSSGYNAQVTMGEFASRQISFVDYSGLNKVVQGNQTIVKSDDGSLELNIFGAPQEYRDLHGTLTTHIDGGLQSFQVVCQKMSEQPVLQVNINNLLAYWKFDEANLTNSVTIGDSKNLAPGTLVTGDPENKSVIGVSKGALRLDGVDDYVNMGRNVLNMGMQNISVSLWIRHVTSSVARQLLGDRNDMGGASPGWNIVYINDSFTGRLSDGTTMHQGAWATLPSNPSAFNHLVVVWDRTNNRMRQYVNGAQVTSIDISNVPGSVTWSGNFIIGCMDAGKAACFDGQIDELSVWNRVLTLSDAQTIYQKKVLY